MVSRREFVRSLALTVGAALMAAGFSATVTRAAEAKAEEAPPLPWPYTRLDPEETRKLGHLGYYAFECAGGAFWAIAVQLREKIGYPWTLLPIPGRDEVVKAVNEGGHGHLACPMQYGYGGAVGWASLCGALNGSLFVINMVARGRDWDRIGKALMRWYEATPLPTRRITEYVVRGEAYVRPEKLKSSKPLPSSVSGSVLCHVSVSRWCRVSGYASGSKERSERCARLTGDVAARAVELLNAYFEGRLDEVAQLSLSPTTAACRLCHYKGKEYEIGQFTRGFMQCESCHRDMRPHAHLVIGAGAAGEQVEGQGGRLATGLGKASAVSAVAAGAIMLGALAVSRRRRKG